MNIEVERISDDGLSRNLWRFSVGPSMLRLTSYHEQTRATSRHKFIGDKWDCKDERRYNSRLDRPTSIPQDIINDALSQIVWSINIGWTNDESRIGFKANKPTAT